jgi:hypothetical protein
VNTLHYKIIIEFANHSAIKILETHNSLRIKKELLLIRRFMGMDEENITIKNERTKMEKED